MESKLTIGYMALNDAAPLVVAKEFGFFEKHGLQVELKKQNSWATLRDKLHLGQLDAAQMLAPMPLASTLGLGCEKHEVMTPLVLSLNGNAITLSTKLIEEILSHHGISEIKHPLNAELLKPVIQSRKQNNQALLRFAHVYPHSCHHYQLRDWFKRAGIQADEVELHVVPPADMYSNLSDDSIDGFCVGGPYNAIAVRQGIGVTVATSCDLWGDAAEKVLGISVARYEQSPDIYNKAVGAVLDACQWLRPLANRFEAALLLSSKDYLGLELDVIAPSLLGSCLTEKNKAPRTQENYNIFCGNDLSLNRPSVLDAHTFATYLYAQGILQELPSEKFLMNVYRDTFF